MITLIVARDRNGAIGKDNTIPWHAPEDLKAFQRETLGGAIIMGRNTWDSLPVKPLKNRLNIVVSSDPNCADLVVPSLGASAQWPSRARPACPAAPAVRRRGDGACLSWPAIAAACRGIGPGTRGSHRCNLT